MKRNKILLFAKMWHENTTLSERSQTLGVSYCCMSQNHETKCAEWQSLQKHKEDE